MRAARRALENERSASSALVAGGQRGVVAPGAVAPVLPVPLVVPVVLFVPVVVLVPVPLVPVAVPLVPVAVPLVPVVVPAAGELIPGVPVPVTPPQFAGTVEEAEVVVRAPADSVLLVLEEPVFEAALPDAGGIVLVVPLGFVLLAEEGVQLVPSVGFVVLVWFVELVWFVDVAVPGPLFTVPVAPPLWTVPIPLPPEVPAVPEVELPAPVWAAAQATDASSNAVMQRSFFIIINS